MSKAPSEEQVLQMIGSFAEDTPWKKITTDLKPFIELSPYERGIRFAEFLRNGCRARSIISDIVGRRVELCYHPDQRNGQSVPDSVFYEYLIGTGKLNRCINRHDTQSIYEAGFEFFDKYFPGIDLYSWARSVDEHGRAYIVMVRSSGRLLYTTSMVGANIGPNCPTLLYES